MDAREFAEWIAYSRIEPWGEGRNDARAMFQAEVTLAPYQKHQKKIKTRDYFPHMARRVADQSDEEIRRNLEGWVRAKGGKVPPGRAGPAGPAGKTSGR